MSSAPAVRTVFLRVDLVQRSSNSALYSAPSKGISTHLSFKLERIMALASERDRIPSSPGEISGSFFRMALTKF